VRTSLEPRADILRKRISLFAELSCRCVEIGVPCIERFFLGSEIALESRLALGNDAPPMGILVEKDSSYLCSATIAENDPSWLTLARACLVQILTGIDSLKAKWFSRRSCLQNSLRGTVSKRLDCAIDGVDFSAWRSLAFSNPASLCKETIIAKVLNAKRFSLFVE
jgi:hypothetical protein